jgi:hypothetical protein
MDAIAQANSKIGFAVVVINPPAAQPSPLPVIARPEPAFCLQLAVTRIMQKMKRAFFRGADQQQIGPASLS